MEGRSPAPAKRDRPWTLIALGVLALYAVVIAAKNSERVKVDFLFFSANTRLLFLVFLCVAIGFVGGFLFARSRARRKPDDE
jgi:uncharacterized integral membrane protein